MLTATGQVHVHLDLGPTDADVAALVELDGDLHFLLAYPTKGMRA